MYFVLVFLWIVFNGKFTIEILLFGMVFSAIIYWFMCKFLDFSIRKDILQFRELGLFIWYAFNLVWEIIKANIGTIKLMFSAKSDVEPVLVTFETDLETRTARILLANSITMTPGTITVRLEDNKYTVHCLDKEMATGLDESSFVQILRKMEEVRRKYNLGNNDKDTEGENDGKSIQ